ncbi:uncharacterized protein [Musca autumnalis]|uniref:uncharacterized protein n=1 Tax=Musca autumnalis TaxID=221902 RepID=UPI003CFB9851
MELHSYAKRRASKKWTIEQKRKLVEARINYDSWFNSKPSNSVVPWKKVLSVAKLDDFNVFFVRKQWSNMLTRYKQYKQTRLDGIATNKAIHAEMIQRINQEWEFFEAIHAFMTRKTTNLHSYAVTQKIAANAGYNHNNNRGGEEQENNESIATKHLDDGHVEDEGGGGVADALQALTRTHDLQHHHHPHRGDVKSLALTRDIGSSSTSSSLMKFKNDCAKENIPNNTTILLQVAAAATGTGPNVVEGIQLFSSDTNEEFEVIGGEGNRDIKDIINKNFGRNTDHDFYSKRSAVVAAAAAAAGSTLLRKFPIEERQLHYFMDTSEESMGTEYVQHTSSLDSSSLPSVMENIELHTENARTFEIKAENISHISQAANTIIKQENFSMTEMPSTSSERNNSQHQNHPTSTSSVLLPPTSMANNNATTSSSGGANKTSERDKYYRHKRRFNRRLEKRFDALLNVVGQIVKTEYPSVDVQPLIDTVSSMATGMGRILSSESEADNNDDTDEGGRNDTTDDIMAGTTRPSTTKNN